MPQFDAPLLNAYMVYFNNWIGAPDGMLIAIAETESSYDPMTGNAPGAYCRSGGACGLMQLKPIALEDIKNNFDVNLDSSEPIQSIVGATLLFKINARYIKKITGKLPDWNSLIVAYNGGYKAGISFMRNKTAPNSALAYLSAVTNSEYFG